MIRDPRTSRCQLARPMKKISRCVDLWAGLEFRVSKSKVKSTQTKRFSLIFDPYSSERFVNCI